EGKKWFSPNAKLNFSKDTFGLEAIVAKAIIETVDKSKKVEAQAKIDKQTTKPVFLVSRKKKGLAKGMKIAASFVILSGVGTALFFSFFSNNPIFPFEQAHIMSIEDSTPLV